MRCSPGRCFGARPKHIVLPTGFGALGQPIHRYFRAVAGPGEINIVSSTPLGALEPVDNAYVDQASTAIADMTLPASDQYMAITTNTYLPGELITFAIIVDGADVLVFSIAGGTTGFIPFPPLLVTILAGHTWSVAVRTPAAPGVISGSFVGLLHGTGFNGGMHAGAYDFPIGAGPEINYAGVTTSQSGVVPSAADEVANRIYMPVAGTIANVKGVVSANVAGSTTFDVLLDGVPTGLSTVMAGVGTFDILGAVPVLVGQGISIRASSTAGPGIVAFNISFQFQALASCSVGSLAVLITGTPAGEMYFAAAGRGAEAHSVDSDLSTRTPVASAASMTGSFLLRVVSYAAGFFADPVDVFARTDGVNVQVASIPPGTLPGIVIPFAGPPLVTGGDLNYRVTTGAADVGKTVAAVVDALLKV